MRLIGLGLLAAAEGFLVNVSSFNVSTQLTDQTVPLKVAFFDFDKTLTVASFGDYYLGKCGSECVIYNVSNSTSCPCNASTNAFGDFFANNFMTPNQALDGPDMLGINGTDRRDRLLQTFGVLASNGVMIRVLSTSWYSINAASWTYFLSKVFLAAGLDHYLNMSTILALDDPGAGLAADKGSRLQTFMNDNNWTNIHQGILSDDSPSNIAKTNGKGDWLQVTPRAGLAVDALEYLEARSQIGVTPAPTQAPTAKSSAMTAVPYLLVSLGALVFSMF